MSKRPELLHDTRTVVYDESHWETLNDLREKASQVMKALENHEIQSFAYGSLARGDVTEASDVDIIIPYPVSSYKLEICLGKQIHRELVQATPSMVLKGHICMKHNLTVTFPLFKLRSREEEFYKWGGQVGLEDIEEQIRVPGVDKRLILIEPNEQGHEEKGVIGYESQVAKRLGVSSDIAHERVRVLRRRDSVGRTGVYLTRPLSEDESFEAVAKSLMDTDPAIRRTAEKRQG